MPVPDFCLVADIFNEANGLPPTKQKYVTYWFVSEPQYRQTTISWSYYGHGRQQAPISLIDGTWSAPVQWQSETDPNTGVWAFRLPDDTIYSGGIPPITGPIGLKGLKDSYAAAPYSWGVVQQPGTTVVTVQGAPGLVNRGIYSNGTQYNTGDWVTFNGGTWAALQPTIGVSPVAGPIWQLQAASGAATSSTNANLIYAGPVSGGAATPAMRVMVDADLPASITASRIAAGLLAAQITSVNPSALTGTGTVPLGALANIASAQLAAAAAITGTQLSNPLTHPGSINAKFFDNGGAVVNVMHPSYGVVGDGVADDTLALRSAITAAGNNSTLLFPPGKTFLLSGIISPITGQMWYGPGAKLKRCNAVRAHFATALTTGTNKTVTLDAVPAGWFVGMDVGIYDGAVAYDNNPHRITAIAGSVITLAGTISTAFASGGYLFSGGFPQIQTASGQQDRIHISGLELDGNASNNTIFNHWELQTEINFQATNYSSIRDCYIHDAACDSILMDGVGTTVISNAIVNSNGNGIHFGASTDIAVIGNFVQNCNLGGIGLGHQDGCIIASNQVHDCIIGYNYCQNGISGIGSFDDDGDSRLVCIGNIVHDCTSSGFEGIVAVGAGSVGNITLIGNQFYNSVKVFILDNDSSFPTNSFYRSIFANNYLENTPLLIGNAKSLHVGGNVIYSSNTTDTLVTISSVQNVSISDNVLVGGVASMTIAAQCYGLTVANNVMRGFNLEGILVNTSMTLGPVHIAGNMIAAQTGETVASPVGISIGSAATNLHVTGNTIDLMGATGSTIGIKLPDGSVSTNGAIVRGNMVRVGGNSGKSSILSNAGSQGNIVADNVVNKAPTLGAGDINIYRNNDVIL